MPIKEKKVISLRYIWRIFTYALDITFVIVASSVAWNMYRLSDEDIMREYLSIATEQRVMFMDGLMGSYAIGISIICLLAATGLLITMHRLVGHELSVRENTERLMFALGYRKRNIILYEEGYVLFDIFLASIAAAGFAVAAGVLLKKFDALEDLCTVLNQPNLVTWEICVAVYAVLFLVIIIGTALQGPFALWRWKNKSS